MAEQDDGRFASEWRIVPASVPGPSHVRQGLNNQDSFRAHALDDGVHVLAVADGAGSRQHSREGSQYAVNSAVEAAQRVFAGPLPRTLGDWQDAMGRYADGCLEAFDRAVDGSVKARTRFGDRSSSPVVRGDYATTLLAVVAARPWFGYLSVGDGFLLVHRSPGGVHLVVPPPLEREHSGQTTFLTSAGREGEVRIGVLLDENVTGLALCTDGLIEGLLALDRGTGSSYQAPDDLDRYFTHFRDPGAEPKELFDQLISPDFAASSGDDKTMVLAVRR